MARPTKLNDDVQKKIVNAVAAGNYYEAACALAGIEYRTFRYWMEKGEAAKSGKYFQFFHAIEQAQARAEVTVVANWKAQIPYSWQAARDFLARRFPDRWKPQEGRELSGEVGTKVMIYIPANKRNDS